MKPDLDPDALEKAAEAVHNELWNTAVSINDKAVARAAIEAYRDHLGLVTLRPLTPEEAKAGIKGDGK